MLHDTKEPVDIRVMRPDVHPQLAKIIMDCLAKEPAARPQSTDEFLRTISHLKSDVE